jgi:aflatoxin B1 aldehyde reductase
LIVETKLYPGANARHTPEDLRKTLQASLTALRADKVELFYLHAPDRTTPWEVTFKAVDELHKEGKFDKVRTYASFLNLED